MNIAVYDEDPTEVKKIIDIIEVFLKERCFSAVIYSFSVIDELFDELDKGVYFDFVFVNLSQTKNFGRYKITELRTKGFCNDIIVMNSEKGFFEKDSNVYAVAYMIKSYSSIGFMKILDDIFEKQRKDEYIIKIKNEIIRIPFRAIRFIESNNSKCTLHTTSGENYVLYKSLNEIEHELSDRMFLRCHRSYIVNMNCIISVDDDIVLNGGEKILIRQRGKKAIKNTFYNYLAKNSWIKDDII